MTVEEYVRAGFTQAQAEAFAERNAPAAGATPPPGAGAPASLSRAERYPNHTPKTISGYDAEGNAIYLHEVVPMSTEELTALGYSEEQAAAIQAEQKANAAA